MIQRLRALAICAGLLGVTSVLAAQDFAPPQPVKIDAATRKKIEEKRSKLSDALAELRKKGIGEPVLAEP